jgi:hypothetical protein
MSIETDSALEERKYAALAYESSLRSAENVVERCFEIRKDLAASLRDVSNKCTLLQTAYSNSVLKE